MESFARHIEYLDKKLYEEVKKEVSSKIPASYIRNLQILRLYKKRGGHVKYSGPGSKPSSDKVQDRIKKEHQNKVRRKDGKKSRAAIYEIDLFAMDNASEYNQQYNEILASDFTDQEKQELIKLHNEINSNE